MMSRAAQTHLVGRGLETPDLVDGLVLSLSIVVSLSLSVTTKAMLVHSNCGKTLGR